MAVEHLLRAAELSSEVVERVAAALEKLYVVAQTKKQMEYKEVCRELHLKQVEEVEEGLTSELTKYFQSQVSTIAQGVQETQSPNIELVYDNDHWHEELVEVCLPVLARGMLEAMLAQMQLLGIPQRRMLEIQYNLGDKYLLPSVRVAKSTAQEWLDSLAPDNFQELPPGVIATDLPDWMKREMSSTLRETFAQPYWRKIPQTTANDIQGFLDRGVAQGESIRTLSNRITEQFPEDYSKTRAKRVAVTESGSILNAGRRAGIDQINTDLPPQTRLVNVWLSILADTTRDAHADNDGVQEDENGLFNLNGVLIPYPAHHSLPASDRISCYCTLLAELVEGGVVTALDPEQDLEGYLANEPSLNLLQQRVAARGTSADEQVAAIRAEKDPLNAEIASLSKQWDELANANIAGELSDAEFSPASRSIYERMEELKKRRQDLVQQSIAAREEGRNLALQDLTAEEAWTGLQVVPSRERVLGWSSSKPTLTTHTSEWKSKLKEAVEFVQKLVPKDTLPQVRLSGHRLPKGSRAFHRRGDLNISGVFLTQEDGVGTFVHEIGHRLEDHLGFEKSWKFRQMRVQRAGTPDVSLKEKFPDLGYGPGEIGNEDGFTKAFGPSEAHYVGSNYAPRTSSEIVSMGIEKLYQDPIGFAKDDPEYFKFMIAYLRGML